MRRLILLQTIINVISRDFSALLVFLLMCLGMAEAISRYFFLSPLMIADEFGAYMVVAIVLIGCAHTWEAKGHIAINTLTRRLPTKVQSWLRLITLFLAVGLCPFLIVASCQLVAYSEKYGVRSESMFRTPLKWPQIVLVIGFALLFVYLSVELIKALRTVRYSKDRED